MIVGGIGYIVTLIVIALLFLYIDKTTNHKIFKIIPSIVIVYLSIMILSSIGLWSRTEEITQTYKVVKSNILPAMIFLMLLQSDIRKIWKLGGKMLSTFFFSTFSIAIGFIGMFTILGSYFPQDAWMPFAALAGSWMGGTANMIAIQESLNLPSASMGYTLLIDSIDYAIWVMILLAMVPFAHVFNKWTKADTSIIDNISKDLTLSNSDTKFKYSNLFLLTLITILVSMGSIYLGSISPTNEFLTTTTWTVLYATTFGILFAMSPLSKITLSTQIGTVLLYILIALIASRANIMELTQAPLYILAGFIILFIHIVIMVVFAKLFKIDLFTVGVASLANIGGVASAPILASSYSKALIPIGILMAMLGYIVGTFGGLLVGNVLKLMAV